MIESFLRKVFSFSRVVSAFIVLLCVVTMIGGAIFYIWSGPDGLEVPSFTEMVKEEEAGETRIDTSKAEAEKLSEQRAIEKKFGDDLEEMVKDYSLDKDFYDSRIDKLLEMDEEFRGDYVKGLRKFMKKGAAYIKEKGENAGFSMPDLAYTYDIAFSAAIMQIDLSKLASKAKRMTTLIVIGSALILMIVFLYIPLLMQIEINTRNLQANRESAPAPAPTPAAAPAPAYEPPAAT